MARITITDPITWHKRVQWVLDNSNECTDATNWSAWQIGLEDIHILVDDHTAVIYYLIWGNDG